VDDPLLAMFVAVKSIVSDTSWHCRSGVTSCPESKYKQLYHLDVYLKMSPGYNIIFTCHSFILWNHLHSWKHQQKPSSMWCGIK